MAHQIITASPIPRLPDSPFPRFPGSPLIHHFKTPSLQIKILLIFLAIFPLFTTIGHAASLRGPWDRDKRQKAFRMHANQSSNPLRFMVELHRHYISPIDGKNCPMYPTCSRYSLQAFQKHGLFVGWVMTCDRLLRCGRDELRLSQEIVVNDELRCYDPLENNDFWWWNKQ